MAGRPVSRANVDYLQEHGPTFLDDLPSNPTHKQRKKFDIQKLKLGAGGRCITYLPEHDYREVLRTFIEEEPSFVEHRSYAEITRRLPKEFRGAWADISEEYGLEPETGFGRAAGEKDICPICGGKVVPEKMDDHKELAHNE